MSWTDGLAVFPLHAVNSGRCGCAEGERCDRPGKHPAMRWGSLLAGEKHFGDHGHGIATGSRSGVFVVDCDGEEGLAEFLELCGGAFPETFTVETPRGGAHFYFLLPPFPVKTSAKELAPHVDIRGEGGFVVMPGSPHKSGGTYVELDSRDPVEAPPELLELLTPRTTDHAPRVADEHAPIPVDLETERGRDMLDQATKWIALEPPCLEGQGGDEQLRKVAWKLVRTFLLPLDAAGDLLSEYNERCSPPWEEWRLRRKLEEARDRGTTPCGTWTTKTRELFERAGTPLALRDRVGESPKRRTKNPSHAYAYHVGDLTKAPEPRKITLADVVSYLSRDPEWAGVLQYDTFAQRVVAVDPPLKLSAEKGALMSSDVTSVRVLLEHKGVAASKDAVADAIECVAQTQEFDPLREYVESLTPGDPSIFHGLAKFLFGTDSEIADTYLRKWFLGGIARALEPGAKFDEMLILSGRGGVGKSRFCEALVPDVAWFCDNVPALDQADAIRQIQGKWIVELAELKNVPTTDVEVVKAFLSRRFDRFTQKYEKNAQDVPRRTLFLGSTNEQNILRDATGNRRFFAIEVKDGHEIPVEWVHENRDRLWSAALACLLSGELLYLDAEEKKAAALDVAEFEEYDEWEELIRTAIVGKATVKLSDVLVSLGITVDRQDMKVQKRAATILRHRLGCTHRHTERGKRWIIPEELQKEKRPTLSIVK